MFYSFGEVEVMAHTHQEDLQRQKKLCRLRREYKEKSSVKRTLRRGLSALIALFSV